MNSNDILILKRALERERKSKEIAESFVENRLRELYDSNIQLTSKVLTQEQFQKDLLENLVDALFVVDFSGNILKLNKEAAKLIGLKRGVIMRKLSEFPKIIHSKLFKLFRENNFNKFDKPFHFEFTNQNNEKKYVDIKTSILIDSENKPYAYQAIVRDITKEHKTSLELEKKKKFEKLERKILKDLLGTNDIFTNAFDLVKHIGEFLNTDDCVFYGLINGEYMQIAALGKKLDADNLIKNKLSLTIDKGILGRVATNKKGEIVNDTSIDKDYIVDNEKRLSQITVPIILDDVVIGIIDSEHPDKNHFTKYQLKALSKISILISIHLKSATSELEKFLNQQELQSTKNRLELIFESYSDAKVIESKDGYIEFVSHSFLDLFKIPIEHQNQLIGLSCKMARENSKGNFVNEEEFVNRIEEIKKNTKKVTNEILELKDGRFVSRNYTPMMMNGKLDGHMWTYKDVTLQVNYDKSIEYENKKYHNIIDNINLGLVEVDNDNKILFANNAFSILTGYDSHELIGKEVNNFLLKPEGVEIINKQKRSRINGVNEIYEIEIITKEGNSKYCLISGATNYDIKGNIIGSIGVHMDITPLKKLNIENENLISRLTNSNSELSNYAHVVSHDLKTPLRTISSCIYWLNEDIESKLSEDGIEYVNCIIESVQDMDKLISNTLQFSELRASSLSSISTCELQPIVNSIINNLTLNSTENLNIKIAKTLPEVNLNEINAKQIFQNILENAFKYKDSKKDSYVNIDWENQGEYIKFSIEDNGIGIDEKHFDLVFEIFKKLNNRTDSSGIGLSIVKKIIESKGGKIWFDSKLGIGTTFYFTVPK